MPQFDMFSDQARRRLAHVYGALQECITDELDYDFGPDVPPFDEDTIQAAFDLIYNQLTALMVAAHAEEVATMEAKVDTWWADFAHQVWVPEEKHL
jgi:hypothetical protein